MKKYTTPEIQVAKFDERDSILTLSGINQNETLNTWGSRVDKVDFVDFNVFK